MSVQNPAAPGTAGAQFRAAHGRIRKIATGKHHGSNDGTGPEQEKSVDIVLAHENGLHARPATKLVETAGRFASEIRIAKDDIVVDGKSVIEILTLAAEKGARLTITARGEDAGKALKALTKLIKSGFES